MRNYRLKPDEEGPVIVYEKFWKGQQAYHPTVHPILVYADLINTHNQRCMEIAQKIFGQYVRPIIPKSG